MKPSPLQLKWLTYPTARYDTNIEYTGEPGVPVDAGVDIEVRYSMEGNHTVFVTLTSDEDLFEQGAIPYEFELVAAASFEIDLDAARMAYRTESGRELAGLVSANISRMVFASAREQLATLTSRAPYRSCVLKSVIIEPSDVNISSPGHEPPEILRHVFGASDEELAKVKSEPVGESAD